MNIYKTTNYEQFERLEGNREINKQNIKNLENAIEQSNKLHLHPIIVNKKMQVIDGHHRLEVAERKELPIYYVIDETEKEDEAYNHIITANVNQKNWSVQDFLNLYATKDKNKDYIEFLSLMNTLNLSVKALLHLLVGRQSPQMIHAIKDGVFTMPKDKTLINKIELAYLQLQEFVTSRKITPQSMFTNSYFTDAYRLFMMNDSVDPVIFFQKLENRWYTLKPQPNSKEWLKSLIDIYNWKNHNKINYEESELEKIAVN